MWNYVYMLTKYTNKPAIPAITCHSLPLLYVLSISPYLFCIFC